MEETKFKVGDKVKLNPNIKTFRWGKGDVSYDEIGTITDISNLFDFAEVIVSFPSRTRGWNGLQTELILVKLKKDDLQFGDILTLRNGERYVVADGCMYGEKEDYDHDYRDIDSWYNDDLTQNEEDKEEDIIKVERAGVVIFEREEQVIKEMTVEEISKALGYEVKVVK